MRCLVITPKRFYMFHKFLAEELEGRGYHVSVLNEEYPENTIGVLLGNFIPLISQKLTLRFFKKHLKQGDIFDLIIIVKGRGISAEAIEYLRGHANRIVGYNFDSFGYNPGPLKWMRSVDKYATFDHTDSVTYSLPKIELFASVDDIESIEKTTDLSVIMKNHSDRLLYLDQISSIFSKIKCEIFIYERNILTLIRNFISHPLLMFKWRRYISFTPLSYSSYLKMISRSIYTLDFAHPKQTGTTIRCFEALGCSTKVVSNNRFILKNPAFNTRNVIIHPLGGDVNLLCSLMQEEIASDCEFQSRTIKEFVNELLL